DPAALPGGAGEHFHDRRFQTFVRVGDDKLHALEPAFDQAAHELRPKWHRFTVADGKADDFALSIGRGRHRDYCRDRDDAPALTDFKVGRIEPEIRPIAFERPLQKRVNALVDLFAELRN